MKRFRILMTAITLACIAALGCGNDSNPAGSSSSSGSFPSGGADGDNAPVTAESAGTVSASFFAAFARVSAAGQAGLATKPIAAPNAENQFKVNGQKSGSATFDGSISNSNSGTNIKATVSFDNFSDDGQLYMQGSLNWNLTTNIDAQNPLNSTVSGGYDGTVNFQGSYKATMKFNITLDNNIPSGSIEITSSGSTFTYNIPTV